MTRVLVTGGAGYIGSVFVESLLKRVGDFELFVVDNLSKGHRELIDPRAKFYEVDLTDFDSLLKVFEEVRPEIVLHFAALSEVGESQKFPEKYYRNNVFGGAVLLRVMKELSCKKIVFSSSAAVYGEPAQVPISEDQGCSPINVYGRTKLLFEKMLKHYEAAYGFKYLSLRYFNAGGASDSGKYGEWHEPESHLIPNVLKAAKEGRVFKIFGDDYATRDGTCLRDYIDVRDLAEAHILGMNYLLEGGDSEILNLGSGEGYTVREIVELCRQVTGVDFALEVYERRLGDPAALLASNQRAARLLNWQPKRAILDTVKSAWLFESGA
ncbi:UDP-glucose 4-epimerase GalE [Candidatus Peregrinibacteria bacterium]|nr:UDP-glucose 4-epimerase GalE [Candidatus Peregrinibacteria bacterium]